MADRFGWAWLVLGFMPIAAMGASDGVHRNTTSTLLKAFERLDAEQARAAAETDRTADPGPVDAPAQAVKGGHQQATFGTGCFWCTEAVFEALDGVVKVVSGYSGGTVRNPTYLQVSTGTTGHAEVVHVQYDPRVVSYSKLLEIFWMSHDPTTLNRQGVDVGPQYRSVIFYHNDQQRKMAVRYIEELTASKAYRRPIVTEVTEFKNFFLAEKYHQDYFALNGRQPYCRQNIAPKVKKIRRLFREDIK